MAAFSGTQGKVYLRYGTAGPDIIEYTDLSEWSFDLSMSPAETTEFGATFDAYVPSTRTATGSFSGNMYNSNAFGTSLAYFQSGGTLSLRLKESTKQFSFDAIITGVGPTISTKGKGEINCAFQSTGAVTHVNV